jgi:hypothetical protein
MVIDYITVYLVIDYRDLVKVAVKNWGGGRNGWVGLELWGLLGFVALVCVWVCFC